MGLAVTGCRSADKPTAEPKTAEPKTTQPKITQPKTPETLAAMSSVDETASQIPASGDTAARVPASAEPFTDRPFTVEVPQSYDSSVPAALLVALHGYTSSGEAMKEYFNLQSLAEQEGSSPCTPTVRKIPAAYVSGTRPTRVATSPARQQMIPHTL